MKRVFSFKWVIVIAIFISCTTTKTTVVDSDFKLLADKGQTFGERKEEIVRRWSELRQTFSGTNYYDHVPTYTAPYSAGKLKDAYLQDAVNTLNFIRFLVGLPDDVELKDEYVELAQYGSVLNAVHGGIGHQQPKPSNMSDDFYQKASKGIGSSNLHAVVLGKAVIGWADDSDKNNWTHLGHRRWILNPSMRYTGFGQAKTFSSVYVFDTSRTEKVDYDAVCYPGGAAFPNEYFKSHYAWSISLNPNIYQSPNFNNIEVKLIQKGINKKTKDRTWIFSKDGSEAFSVNNERLGLANCIVFIPSGIRDYSGTYIVEVTGLNDKEGNPVFFRYETTFFSLTSRN